MIYIAKRIPATHIRHLKRNTAIRQTHNKICPMSLGTPPKQAQKQHNSTLPIIMRITIEAVRLVSCKCNIEMTAYNTARTMMLTPI